MNFTFSFVLESQYYLYIRSYKRHFLLVSGNSDPIDFQRVAFKIPQEHKSNEIFLVEEKLDWTISYATLQSLKNVMGIVEKTYRIFCDMAKLQENIWCINPFAPKAPFLYPLKTSENRED